MKIRNCIFLVSILIFLFLVCFLGDHFMGINYPAINNLTNIMLPSAIAFVCIWTTGYFLLLQVYKNRYPLEMIRRYVLNDVVYLMIVNFYIICIGSLCFVYFTGMIMNLFFCLSTLVFILFIIVFLYKLNRTLMINTYIEKYVEDFRTIIKGNDIQENNIITMFRQLQNIYEECIDKDESYVCKHIIKKMNTLFISLLENYDRLVLNKHMNAEHFFDIILNNLIRSISYTNKRNKSELSYYILIEYFKYINLCIKLDKNHLFESCITKLNKFIYISGDRTLLLDLLHKYCDLIQEINNNLTYRDFIAKDISEMAIATIHNNDTDVIDIYLKFYIQTILDSNDKSLYSRLVSDFDKFLYVMSKLVRVYDSLIISFYHFYFETKKKNDFSKIEDLYSILNKIDDNIEAKIWNDFYSYVLVDINDSYPEQTKLAIREKQVATLMDRMDKNSNDLIFPDYPNLVSKNRQVQDIIKTYAEELKRIILRSIYKESTSTCFQALQCLHECILGLHKTDAQAQETLVSVYGDFISNCFSTENQTYFQIGLSKLDDCLRKLDSENKVSKNLGKYVINMVKDITIERFSPKDEFSAYIVDSLHSFRDATDGYHFLEKDIDLKKTLYEAIYEIGLQAIESNNIVTLKRTSNSLGWSIKLLMDNGEVDLCRDLMRLAYDLYRLTREAKLSDSTQIFICTLFAVIGPYCYIVNLNMAYRTQIIEYIKAIDPTHFKIAMDLRQQNFSNDDFYKGNYRQCLASLNEALRK